MKIKDFFFYIYYRTDQLYKKNTRSDGPVALFLALNISVVFNLFLQVANFLKAGPGDSSVPFMIVGDCAILFLTYTVVLIYKLRNRKIVNRAFSGFSKETPEERRKMGGKVIWYIVGSVLALVVTYVVA